MSVKKIMSSPALTVKLDDELTVVDNIFSSTNFHHLLVVEKNKLFGVISDRDLLKALSPKIGTASERLTDIATLHKRVHQVMSRKPICLQQNKSVHDAITLFLENNISCIPIVDSNNCPVGIVSWRDVLKAISKPKP
jgi:acetoin utilization protein AcuB